MIRLSVSTIQFLGDMGDFNAQSALNTHNQLENRWRASKPNSESIINFDKNCIFEFRTYMDFRKNKKLL